MVCCLRTLPWFAVCNQRPDCRSQSAICSDVGRKACQLCISPHHVVAVCRLLARALAAMKGAHRPVWSLPPTGPTISVSLRSLAVWMSSSPGLISKVPASHSRPTLSRPFAMVSASSCDRMSTFASALAYAFEPYTVTGYGTGHWLQDAVVVFCRQVLRAMKWRVP